MKEVDFAKLSEQYASFLVAVGGVSITVLALVLSLASPSNKLKEGDLGSFLISALIVATVCCFTGAHMMAETAALIGRAKELLKDKPPLEIPPTGTSLGECLFLLASTNIFIAIFLVLFAVMLLPSASTLPDADSIRWISFLVFLSVTSGALLWMVLAAKHRVSIEVRWKTIVSALGIGLLAGCIPSVLSILDRKLFLWFTFILITLLIVASLLYFAWNLKDSDKVPSREIKPTDILFFGAAVTLSYIALIIAGIRTMFW